MRGSFRKVANTDEIRPGKMKRVKIDGHALLIANVDGNYYAVDDTCTHEDASLSTGSLKRDLIKCPLHGSRFNVRTGVVLEEPAEEDLKTYRVVIDDSAISIEWP